MERKLYYDSPKQVKFIDVNYDDGSDNQEPHWLGGIAYRDEIICGCCGGIISLEDLYADWDEWAQSVFPNAETPVVTYDYWVDFEAEIRD